MGYNNGGKNRTDRLKRAIREQRRLAQKEAGAEGQKPPTQPAGATGADKTAK